MNKMASHFNHYFRSSPNQSIIAAATNGTRAYPPRVHPSQESGSKRYENTEASCISTLNLDIPLHHLGARTPRGVDFGESMSHSSLRGSRSAHLARHGGLDGATHRRASKHWSYNPSYPPSPDVLSPLATARSYREMNGLGQHPIRTPAFSACSYSKHLRDSYREGGTSRSFPVQGTYYSGIESDQPKIASSDWQRAASPQKVPEDQSPNSWDEDIHQAFDATSNNPLAIKRYPKKTTCLSRYLEHQTFRHQTNLR